MTEDASTDLKGEPEILDGADTWPPPANPETGAAQARAGGERPFAAPAGTGTMPPRTPLEQINIALLRSVWIAGVGGALLCASAIQSWFSWSGADAALVSESPPSMTQFRIVAFVAGVCVLVIAFRHSAILRGDSSPASVLNASYAGWVCLLVMGGDLIWGGIKVSHYADRASAYGDVNGASLSGSPSLVYFLAIGGAVALLVSLLILPIAGLRERESFTQEPARQWGGVGPLRVSPPASIGHSSGIGSPVASEHASRDAAASDDFKVCPSCAEQVRSKATVCRFCRHEFKLNDADPHSA